MTEESVFVAMTTEETDTTQTSDGNVMMSSYSYRIDYVKLAVLLMGIVGTAGNALVLYALFASKQHKKHALIVNQNALDLFSSVFLVVTYSVQTTRIRLSGVLGYWLCIILLSENLIWSATNGSMVNLAIITIDRYLKVVRPALSKKYVRPWMVYSAMAIAWFVGFVFNTATVVFTSAVIDGKCHSYVFFNNLAESVFAALFYIVFFYVIILIIFIFCYSRILATIRRRARAMASHSAAGPSNASQAQSHRIQSNVIKTMVLVSAFFAIAWLPYNIYSMLVSTALAATLTYADSAFHATMFLALFYTCTNPFIYATKFDPVREVLLKLIPCKKNSVQPAGGGAVNAGGQPGNQRTG